MNAAPITIQTGSLISHLGRTYCVRKVISPEEVLATDVEAGDDQMLSTSAITARSTGAADQSAERIDLEDIPEIRWQNAMVKYRAIAPLVGHVPRATSKVRAVADQLMVSVATIYRWLDCIEHEGSVSCMLRKRRVDAGVKRLDSRVDALIKDVILSGYLTELRKSPEAAMRAVAARCSSEGLPVPSKVAVLSRIAEIHPEERSGRRQQRRQG